MEERRNEILRELDRKGRVKVTDLSKEFGCSEVTIRNDHQGDGYRRIAEAYPWRSGEDRDRNGSKREIFGGIHI